MNRILCVFTVFANLVVSAQEVCNNGLDDDGDGLVDCFDADCSFDGACENFFFGKSAVCSYSGEFSDVEVSLQWESGDETAATHASPVVGDLNNDRVPEVVATNSFTNYLYILDGKNGGIMAKSNLSFTPSGAPAIAKIANDNLPTIFLNESGGTNIASYRPDIANGALTRKWTTSSSLDHSIGTIGIADFDENGTSEIYYRNEIMDAATGEVLIEGSGNWEQDWVHTPLAIDILKDSECSNCSGLELVTGNEVWAVNLGTKTLTLAADLNEVIATQIDGSLSYFPKYNLEDDTQWSSISCADYNLDGKLDLVITGSIATSFAESANNSSVILWDVTNASISVFDNLDEDSSIGKVTLADISNNGYPNAIFSSDGKLIALNESFSIYWTYATQNSSVANTCTVFDLNGDDAKEVIYKDGENLLILNGLGNGDQTTSLIESAACKSASRKETPIVADVDFDGAAEICVACLTNDAESTVPLINNNFGQLRLYESKIAGWVPTRSVWNQLSYHNVNVNDDLTIPQEVQDHSTMFSEAGLCRNNGGSDIPFPARPLNAFGTQSNILDSEGCVSNVTADLDFAGILTVSDPSCISGETDVQFQVVNIGDRAIHGSIPISYYLGDPFTNESHLLTTIYTPLGLFDVNNLVEVSHHLSGIIEPAQLYVALNHDGNPPLSFSAPPASILECDLQNNFQSTAIFNLSNNLNVTICEGDTYKFGDQTLSEAGVYTETFADEIEGCQEVTLNLSIQTPEIVESSVEICEGEVFLFGSQSLTEPGSYTETFSSTTACDSTVNLELAVSQVNTSITISNGTLAVEETANATYRWVNCDTEQGIDGGSSFSPSSSGRYAVIVDNGVCRILSNCVDILILSATPASEHSIYPNPVNQFLTIAGIPNSESYEILSLAGQTIEKGNLKRKGGEKINVAFLQKGIYILKIVDSQSNAIYHRLVKE